MICLSVNLNGAAYIRNRRGVGYAHHLSSPNVVRLAKIALAAGAHGITVHPRSDERHIRASDLPALRRECKNGKEFNMEGYPDDRFLALIEEIKPDQITLVPDGADQTTSDHGWPVAFEESRLREAIGLAKRLKKRISVFVDTDEEQIRYHHSVGVDRIELYTGPFASENNPYNLSMVCEELAFCAEVARGCALEMNAGHDLNLANLNLLVRTIPDLSEVSIGQALMGDALAIGMKGAVQEYLQVLSRLI